MDLSQEGLLRVQGMLRERPSLEIALLYGRQEDLGASLRGAYTDLASAAREAKLQSGIWRTPADAAPWYVVSCTAGQLLAGDVINPRTRCRVDTGQAYKLLDGVLN